MFVAALYAVNDDYYIIYPRSTEGQREFMEKNEWRTTTNNLLYDNLRFVVGMSWFDSVTLSVLSSDASNSESAAIYWSLAVGGIAMSVIGTHYIKKWELQRKIANQGIVWLTIDAVDMLNLS